jgi:hypothetical protein
LKNNPEKIWKENIENWVLTGFEERHQPKGGWRERSQEDL